MSTTIFTNDKGDKASIFVQDEEGISPSMVKEYKKKITVRQSRLILRSE